MRTWSSCSEAMFDQPFDFCLVSILRDGGRPELPGLSGGFASTRGALIVICADAGSWQHVRTAYERASHATGDTLPPSLLVLADDDGLGAALDAALARVQTESVLFADGGARLDLLAVSRAAAQHAACGHVPLHVEWNHTSVAGLRCRYGSYLRFRTSIDGAGLAVSPLPRRPEELMLSRSDASTLGRRLCVMTPSSAWRRLLALGTFVTAPETASSPVIVGDLVFGHGERSEVPSDEVQPEFTERAHEVRSLLERLVEFVKAAPTSGHSDFSHALLALDIEMLRAWLSSPVGDDEFSTALRLDPLVMRAAVNEAEAIRLASVVLDHFDLGGLDSLECDHEAFEQQLLRDFADAVLGGAFGRVGDTLVRVLSCLCGRARNRDWPLSAADLGWSAHCLLDALTGKRADAENIPQASARLRHVLGARLADDRATPARQQALVRELRQAHAMLAELYPGRLATLIITTLRGSWCDWIRFPVKLIVLAWQAVFVEGLRGRISR